MSSTNKAKVVTLADSLSTIKLNVGDSLIVKLKGNPSTGYGWYTDLIDTMLVKELATPKPLPPEKSLRVGEPKTTFFHFEAIASGRTALRLVYKRIWEKEIPPAKVFEIKLDIANSK